MHDPGKMPSEDAGTIDVVHVVDSALPITKFSSMLAASPIGGCCHMLTSAAMGMVSMVLASQPHSARSPTYQRMSSGYSHFTHKNTWEPLGS